MSGDQAWVTLATNDSYALGALVVARSLKRVNTTRKLVVMITPGVTGHMRETLSTEFDTVFEVNVLDSEDSANLALLTRPELGITFTKLHCWRLTQFSKCVFLDADTLILQNCDELFDRTEFSAAPDVGWPDCFNSGVFVFTPSIETYNKLLAFAVASGSFDGGDQGLLNLYFNDWSVSDISRHLPFIYNMVASATYSYLPAFKVFGANVKIVHFIGPDKPWLMYFDSATATVRAPYGQEHLQELLQAWWDIFRADVHNKLSPDMSGLAGAFAKMKLEGEKSEQQIEYEGQMRKHAWESGHIDYLGKDSFDNILKKIQESMAQTTETPAPVVEPPPPKKKSKSPSPPKVASTPAPVQEPSSAPPASEAQPVSAPQAAPAEAPVSEPPPQVAPIEEPISAPQPQVAPVDEPVSEPQPPQAAPTEPPVSAPQTQEAPIAEPVPTVQGPATTEAQPVSALQAPPSEAPAPAPQAAPSEAPVSAPQPQSDGATEQAPVPQAAATDAASAPVPAAQVDPTPAPVAEAAVQAAPVAEVSAPVGAAPVPTPEPTPEELEEAKLAEERQALEKKLAEQKRIAEQKLQEEKQAAEARAAALVAESQQKASASTSEAPSAPLPEQAQAEPEPEPPVAPPRRQSKALDHAGRDRTLWRVGCRFGLGLSCVAVVVYAIYNYNVSVSLNPPFSGGSGGQTFNNNPDVDIINY